MAENIVHLVLARLPDAPKGRKGISLFVVPKFMVNADGSLGARNVPTAWALSTRWASRPTPPPCCSLVTMAVPSVTWSVRKTVGWSTCSS